MGENKGLEGEIKLPGGSFSRLLLSSDDNVEEKPLLLCVNSSAPHQTPLFSNNTPKMLCFGDFNSKNISPKPTFTTVVNDTSKESKPTFTKLNDTNNNLITHISNNNNNNKRRNGSGKESGHGSGNGQKNGMMKKNKPEMGPVVTSSLGHAKARREKLGERISVLQQLVCPYGKTDTASVLHEAMGYIRFLHDQVKVLSTPYLKRLPSSWSSLSPHQSINENGATAKDSTDGLKDMGLCLVPLEYILQVASSNGADFWPPTNISSSGV